MIPVSPHYLNQKHIYNFLRILIIFLLQAYNCNERYSYSPRYISSIPDMLYPCVDKPLCTSHYTGRNEIIMGLLNKPLHLHNGRLMTPAHLHSKK